MRKKMFWLNLDIQKQEEEEELVQTKSGISYKKPSVESRSIINQTGNSNTSLEKLLQTRKGTGMPLPDDVRKEMESYFNADLSMVRIHSDFDATHIAKTIKTQAFRKG